MRFPPRIVEKGNAGKTMSKKRRLGKENGREEASPFGKQTVKEYR